TQHIRRPHKNGILHMPGTFDGFFHAGGNCAGRLRDIEFFQQLAEAPAAFRGKARFSGVCPPNCTITPMGAPLCASCWQTANTSSKVRGSKYKRSLVS